MLAKHLKMWDGSLGLINIAQQQIELKEKTHSILLQLDLAG